MNRQCSFPETRPPVSISVPFYSEGMVSFLLIKFFLAYPFWLERLQNFCCDGSMLHTFCKSRYKPVALSQDWTLMLQAEQALSLAKVGK